MEKTLKFNSQVATSRVQSERLLALGLKKETADCVWIEMSKDDWRVDANGWKAYYSIIEEGIAPAWSLDRLKELYKCVGDTSLWNLDDVNYDRLIQCIGLAIKHNSFNKEYLE